MKSGWINQVWFLYGLFFHMVLYRSFEFCCHDDLRARCTSGWLKSWGHFNTIWYHIWCFMQLLIHTLSIWIIKADATKWYNRAASHFREEWMTSEPFGNMTLSQRRQLQHNNIIVSKPSGVAVSEVTMEWWLQKEVLLCSEMTSRTLQQQQQQKTCKNFA